MGEASQPGERGAAAPSPALRTALRRLLRPLVRMLLDRRVTFPELAALLKEVFVEVADRELPIAGRPQTTTRISLLTGIHRKDVKRLREETRADRGEMVARSASLGAQLVARWQSEERWLDSEGKPRPLARVGPSDSFEALVASVSKDIRARAVLDEWLRVGFARRDEEDQIHLNVSAFVPESGFDEKAFFFGRNLRDHVAAGAHNLAGRTPPMPDRSVYYGGLGVESIEELAVLSERLGMDALQQVNRRARALQKKDLDREGSDQRMNLGFYFFRGPDTPEDDDGE